MASCFAAVARCPPQTGTADVAAAFWKKTLTSHLVATISGAGEQHCSEETNLKKTVRAPKEKTVSFVQTSY